MVRMLSINPGLVLRILSYQIFPFEDRRMLSTYFLNPFIRSISFSVTGCSVDPVTSNAFPGKYFHLFIAPHLPHFHIISRPLRPGRPDSAHAFPGKHPHIITFSHYHIIIPTFISQHWIGCVNLTHTKIPIAC